MSNPPLHSTVWMPWMTAWRYLNLTSETRAGDYISKALKVKVLVGKALKLLPDINAMPVKTRRFPDVTIKDETGATFFIIQGHYSKASHSLSTNAVITEKPVYPRKIPSRVLLSVWEYSMRSLGHGDMELSSYEIHRGSCPLWPSCLSQTRLFKE